MSESIAPDPISADTLRTLAVAELTTIQNLLVYLDLGGLQFVRNRLRSNDLARVCDEGPLAETRAVLLDTACWALVASGWASEQYFLGSGDMLPSAPDTIEDDGVIPVQRPSLSDVDEPAEGEPWKPEATPDMPLEPDEEDLTELDDEPGDGWV